MAEYTKIVPCKITYTYNPAEKETMSEPGVAEEFTVEKMVIGDINIMPMFEDVFWDKIDDLVYEYLKETGDD